MSTPLHGRCVCGAIQFACSGQPLRATVCHCLWCQRRTGTAFGTEVVFEEAQVSFAGIAPSSYRHISDASGRWLDVLFCPQCGTHLGFTLEAAPGVRTLPAGAFDDPGVFSADRLTFRQVFTRSRRNWGSVTLSVDVHEAYFPGR